ncbi:hypothetical protein JTB14_037956 [Gonioctena quinquepunctata]|nr:hypothetical protein JTB14_037956 [Gonioctena quinquepunctata]
MSEIKVETDGKVKYKEYFPTAGFIKFKVRAPHDAGVLLSTMTDTKKPYYEVFLGQKDNTVSSIFKNNSIICEVQTPHVLDPKTYRGFWIRWQNNHISAGRDKEVTPFICWTDPRDFMNIRNFSACTVEGAAGSWTFDTLPNRVNGGPFCETFNRCWEASKNGEVPSRPFEVGEDERGPIYVVRAEFEGCLIPGMLVQRDGVCHIPYGGAAIAVSEYEVLCNFPGQWMHCTAGIIPPKALAAGHSNDGELLYVGKVICHGAVTVGSVHPSRGLCYVPYGEKKMSFCDYEILVCFQCFQCTS